MAPAVSDLTWTVMVIPGLFAFHHWLIFYQLDPLGAQVVGVRANVVEYAFLVLLALVIVIGIQAAGIVLVMAMLVTPAADRRLPVTS